MRSVLIGSVVLVVAGALTACSAGPAATTSTASTASTASAATTAAAESSPSVSASASAPAGDVDPETAALLSLSPTEQEAQLAALSASLERDLWTQSGLESEIGGAAATDQVFAELTSAMVAQAKSLRDDPSFGRQGGPLPAAEEITLGGGMFAGWMIAGVGVTALVDATNGLKPGEMPEPVRKGDDGNTLEMGGTLETGSLVSQMEKTINGVTGKVRTTIDISPCPTAAGEFSAKVVIEASATTSGGRTGTNMTTEVTVTGNVGDNAEMIGYETASRTQAADFTSSKGSYVDVSSATSYVGDKVTDSRRKQNRSGGSATEQMAQEWANMSMLNEILIGEFVVRAAEKGWKSGRCVEVQVTTSPEKRTGLAPSTAVSVVAAPTSKIDGGPVGGTVTSSLNGGTSIDPANSRVPADATFAYTAPGEKDQSATVTLVATSKRGIGKAEVRFDTKASRGYFIGPATGGSHVTKGLGINSSDDGSSLGTAEPADVCDITKPFTLTAPATGGTQTFTPTSPTGGTTTYETTPMTGFVEKGKGTYTLTLEGDGGTIRTKIRGKLTLPGGAQSYGTSGVQIFDLKPSMSCP